ncbi:MAG TPA: hypothetical protein VHO70_06420 [Chitinispirillaceae bacterium]|nr:hypothetical protein [Chitinispirillaceae bacterium]
MKAKKYPKISIATLVQRANDITNACYNDKVELLPEKSYRIFESTL